MLRREILNRIRVNVVANDLFISICFISIARWIVLKVKQPLLRSILGPFLGGVMIAFMKIGIVEDSLVYFSIALATCIYLFYISGENVRD